MHGVEHCEALGGHGETVLAEDVGRVGCHDGRLGRNLDSVKI
jgi:hypothetical protein